MCMSVPLAIPLSVFTSIDKLDIVFNIFLLTSFSSKSIFFYSVFSIILIISYNFIFIFSNIVNFLTWDNKL